MRLIPPILALGITSLAGCTLLGARRVWVGHGGQIYLVWNLCLAWLPLWFAIALQWWSRSERSNRWLGAALAAGWLLFFPNAPYLLTDLVHLGSHARAHYWTDLVLILVFALTGLVLGFVSLFLMHHLVVRRLGWVGGWIFVGGTALANGFGIYAGRFLRWNSWDAVLSPVALLSDGARWIASAPGRPQAVLLPLLFAALIFLTYVMLYGLTHLRRQEEAGRDNQSFGVHVEG